MHLDFAQVAPKSIKVHIEDPRGINPPYGKTHVVTPQQGELVMFPSWISHVITPNTAANSTVVVFAFCVYPVEGPTDLDWEDDPTGSMVVKKEFELPKAPYDSARHQVMDENIPSSDLSRWA